MSASATEGGHNEMLISTTSEQQKRFVLLVTLSRTPEKTYAYDINNE